MSFTPSSINNFGGALVHVTSTNNAAWSTSVSMDLDYPSGNGDGGLFTDAGGTTPYVSGARTDIYLKLPNKKMSFNLVQTGSVAVTVSGDLLVKPSYAYDFVPNLRGTIVNRKRDGSINGRILGDGVLYRDYNLNWQNLTVAEYLELEWFWNLHALGKNLNWRYQDPILNIDGFFMWDSPLQVTVMEQNRISCRSSIVGVPA